jgi:ATP-binding cassette subfamily C exporter for protease/lipase
MKSVSWAPGSDVSWLSTLEPALRKSLATIFAYGALTNLLALAPSVYMLEVYGRVVSSRSMLTLAMLTLLILALYAWMEMVEWVRESLMQRLSNQIEIQLSPRIWGMSLQGQLAGSKSAAAHLSDVHQLRSFLTSHSAIALLDLPFSIVVMVILFSIHFWFGVASIFAAAALAVVTYITHQSVHKPMNQAQQAAQTSQMLAVSMFRQSESISAMGMQHSALKLWQESQDVFLKLQASASRGAGWGSAFSRFIQLLQGSLLLGLGCWLTLLGILSANGGLMIVATILAGKAMSPIVQLIIHSRSIHQAWSSWQRLDQFLGPANEDVKPMTLPVPKGLLTGTGLSLRSADGQFDLLKGVQFRIEPGQLLAVIGPSGAGKTCLSRMIVGIWPPTAGKVRLDGVDIHGWDRTEIGPHIGYLPQNIELFDVSLGLNISRFNAPNQQLLAEVIQATGLQSFVANLPSGLETQLGVDGHLLSGGMRQRVGLARAFYGWPKLVVLDEPNAHLDDEGETQLNLTLAAAKQRGCTVVLITHRTSVLALADQLMVLRDGQMEACGPRDEVISALHQAVQKSRQAAEGLK